MVEEDISAILKIKYKKKSQFHFWLRQGVTLSVCPAQTCLKVSIFILKHLGQSQVSLGSVSGQSQVSLSSVKTEPKILRLVCSLPIALLLVSSQYSVLDLQSKAQIPKMIDNK